MGRRPAALEPKEVTINGNQTAWLVTVPEELRKREDVKGGRKYFPKRGLAQAYCNRLKDDLRNYSDKARGLSDAQKIEAQSCFERLATSPGASMTEAVDQYLVRRAQAARSVTLEELGVAFLKAKADAGGRGGGDRTLQEHRTVWAQFVKAFPKRLATEIAPEEIHGWLFGLRNQETGEPLALQTRKNIRRVIHTEFSFAMERVRRWVSSNPVTDVKLPDAVRERVDLLPLPTVARMFDLVHPRMVPYLAFCAFAGTRPDQAKAIDWAHVHFDRGQGGEIEVPAGTDKTDRERIVPMQPNLRAFLLLTPEDQRRGTVFYSKRFFTEMRVGLGMQEWPQDCLRHNYCTYRLKIVGSFGRVADEAGNSEKVIRDRYYRSVSQSEAEAYWQISPSSAVIAKAEAYWPIYRAAKSDRQAESRWRDFCKAAV